MSNKFVIKEDSTIKDLIKIGHDFINIGGILEGLCRDNVNPDNYNNTYDFQLYGKYKEHTVSFILNYCSDNIEMTTDLNIEEIYELYKKLISK